MGSMLPYIAAPWILWVIYDHIIWYCLVHHYTKLYCIVLYLYKVPCPVPWMLNTCQYPETLGLLLDLFILGFHKGGVNIRGKRLRSKIPLLIIISINEMASCIVRHSHEVTWQRSRLTVKYHLPSPCMCHQLPFFMGNDIGSSGSSYSSTSKWKDMERWRLWSR